MRHIPTRLTLAAAVAVLALVAAAPAAAGAWTVDAAHSSVGFSAKHFFTPVKGSFEDFEIELAYDAAKPANSSVKASIAIASVRTGNERRDGHLKTADFFEADTHPRMTFESASVRAAGDGKLVADGTLTIKGVARPVSLDIEILGIKDIPEDMQANMGGTKQIASFRASTTIDRSDFGVGTGSWAADLVVANDVAVEILVEAKNP